jgi:hypothetical protein
VRRLFAELADSIERATYLIGMIDGAEIYLDGGSWSIANGAVEAAIGEFNTKGDEAGVAEAQRLRAWGY